MFLNRWLRPSKHFGSETKPARASRFRPQVESLEVRTVPSQVNLSVSSLAYSGPGTLRSAILAADVGGHSDKFTIGFGITGTIDLQTPLPDLNNTIAIQGPGASSLTVERAAGYSFASAIITVDAGQTASLSGLTIANGSNGGIGNLGTLALSNCAIMNNSHAPDMFTGGIFNTATLTISGCVISNNSAVEGGAIYNSGTVTVSNSTLSCNTADDVGGAIFSTRDFYSTQGGTLILSGSTVFGNTAGIDGGGIATGYDSPIGRLREVTTTISGCTISRNTAVDNNGGGIWAGGLATVSGSTISGNSARDAGGGIYTVGGEQGSGLGSDLTVGGCTFTGNAAGTGGGIFGFVRSNNTVRDSIFAGNSAKDQGGAIFNFLATTTITGCTFSGNAATQGGGIFNDGWLDVRGSAFSGNTASASGGGVYNFFTARLQQCTLVGNSATHGGGIFNGTTATDPTYGTLSVNDSTVLGNFALVGADLFNEHGSVNVNDSLIADRYDA